MVLRLLCFLLLIFLRGYCFMFVYYSYYHHSIIILYLPIIIIFFLGGYIFYWKPNNVFEFDDCNLQVIINISIIIVIMIIHNLRAIINHGR